MQRYLEAGSVIRFAQANLLESQTAFSKAFWGVLRQLTRSKTGSLKLAHLRRNLQPDVVEALLQSPILYYSPMHDSITFRYTIDFAFAQRHINQQDRWKVAVPIVGFSMVQLLFGGLGKLIFIPAKFL